MRLGRAPVNRVGFGAMRVIDNGSIWGEPSDRAKALKVLRRAVELGVNFFDTAESYGPHTSEILIAEALHPYPQGFVIGPKGGIARPRASRWDADGRPEKLKKDLDGSLKRLRLERIDLYQLHAVDPEVPLEVSLGALADMQREGKIRHIGVSNFNVDQLERARKVVNIVSVQNRYSLSDRSSEDVLKACEKLGIVFLPWYPLGDGAVLRIQKLKDLAKKLQATPAQVGIAWLLGKSPVIMPIPRTPSIAHREENVAAAKLKLGDDDFRSL